MLNVRAVFWVCVTLCVASVARGEDPQFPLPATVADGAKLVQEYADPRFFEGPTWDATAKKLLFTAFGEGNQTQILRLEGPNAVSVWADQTEGVNGTYRARNGRMLGAQAYGHRVLSYGLGTMTGSDVQILLHDTKLFQPNDVVEAPNGDIYFTDPDFKKEQASAVYVLRKNGDAKVIIQDMPVPNGLEVSLDGKTLYVGDSKRAHWKAYPIQGDGSVGPGYVFFDPPTPRRNAPDGMCIDGDGNAYFTGRGGVWVADPYGKSLGLIPVPEFCSNVTFGGEDGKTLYLTCSKKIYSLKMKVAGDQSSRAVRFPDQKLGAESMTGLRRTPSVLPRRFPWGLPHPRLSSEFHLKWWKLPGRRFQRFTFS
ncbi:MAG: SMP-30/gluconolactonase/LRE family protein [Planctomycetales bacterium]